MANRRKLVFGDIITIATDDGEDERGRCDFVYNVRKQSEVNFEV